MPSSFNTALIVLRSDGIKMFMASILSKRSSIFNALRNLLKFIDENRVS